MVPALGVTDIKAQAISSVLTSVTTGARNFHDFPLRKKKSTRSGTSNSTRMGSQVT